MKEIGLTKQKILLIVLVSILVLAMIMLTVMFIKKGKKTDKSKNNKKVTTMKKVDKHTGQNNAQNAQKATGKGTESNLVKGKITKLDEGEVFGLTLRPGTNKIMFYKNGKVLSIDPYTEKKVVIAEYPFLKVKEFFWNQTADKAIVKDFDEYFTYDLGNNLANKFRYGIDIAFWDRSGNKVIYKFYDKDSRQRKVAVADMDGTNPKIIFSNEPYRRVDFNLQPKTNRFCYYPTPDARVKGTLFCSDMEGKNNKEYGGNYGQDYLWSPDGQKILTSYTQREAGNRLVLGVMNKDGGEFKGLSFATTVKKCVWSYNNVDVYCAMIGGAPLDIMLPNGWAEEKFNSLDTFWKIDTKTGKKERLIELSDIPSAIDSEQLVVDPEENFLFFRGRRDGSLWRLKL